MKKLALVLILFVCFSTVGLAPSLFAEMDLTSFPSCMDENSWILNFGLGLGGIEHLSYSNAIWVPPLRLSFDRNAALGDNGLPFFFGGLVTYSGKGYRNHQVYENWRWTSKNVYYSTIGMGFRCGYHFNWGVDMLDTYAVSTAGWAIHTGDRDVFVGNKVGHPVFGVQIGARWFLNDLFGFWAETGWNGLSWFDLGISLKF